ncbi:MAG: hypothetical protein JNN08_21165 [Bryobacterales bacterium]|nr:hypothetical protein [Bryobacterales bacterium]
MLSRLRHLFEQPWALPAVVVAMQLVRLRGILHYRDLTPGDTSYYFAGMERAAADGRFDLVWSPLYTALSLALYGQTGDALLVAVGTRVITLLVLGVLTGSVLARCLPPWIAVLVSAWWVFEPVLFDTVYEVHLFSALGPVAALWISLRYPGAAGRATILALLFVWALLQRQEYGIAAVVAGAMYVWQDVVRKRAWRPYAAALFATLALLGMAWTRSALTYPELRVAFDDKRALNNCQNFAGGYQERHPEWTGSPTLECSGLLQEQFGTTRPSAAEMVLRNWRAMAEHYWWNIQLIPAGIEVLLFSQTSFTRNPDYVPVVRTRVAHWYLGAIAILWLAGGWLLYRGRREAAAAVRTHWTFSVLAGALIAASAVVLVTYRPRASYLFPLQLLLMLGTGFAVRSLASRLGLGTALNRGAPVFALVAVAAMPAYYQPERFPQRPLLTMYRRLLPHRAELSGLKLIAPDLATEVCNYIARGGPPCQGAYYYALRAEIDSGDLQKFLQTRGIQAAYWDAATLAEASIKEWLSRHHEQGWTIVAQVGGPDPWVLVRKQ